MARIAVQPLAELACFPISTVGQDFFGSGIFIFPDLGTFFGAFTVFCRKTKFLITPVFCELI